MAVDSSEMQCVPVLYTEHRTWLHAWLHRQVGCREQAADLVQDTFLRVLLREETLRIRQPRAFLARIAHGLMVDSFRRAALERAYLAELALLPEAVQPSPEDYLSAMQALREIDRLLSGLSDKARAAFVWRQVEGLGQREIAERLGVSVPRVHQYLAQAMLQVYTALYGAPVA
ncbi:sigma-70 family RNA polymerase sigma factor [Bordetella sp. N]|uniref:sigma-70 family RNA polymerase sigma factor n=1 Tax=Bordetella sp. N TaxID=1746199 RepID=UPI000709BC7D|nr:sigma-70 family RNA polymerase sigma factor [Bordetella sp. N]ALM81672.1 RNA polymerase subunit sigma [Bordetella sp. N]